MQLKLDDRPWGLEFLGTATVAMARHDLLQQSGQPMQHIECELLVVSESQALVCASSWILYAVENGGGNQDIPKHYHAALSQGIRNCYGRMRIWNAAHVLLHSQAFGLCRCLDLPEVRIELCISGTLNERHGILRHGLDCGHS